jgi:hypothetical protein
MSEVEVKPLNWKPTPGIGYTVTRRPDGGMHFIFLDASPATLAHWREFALEHLYDSDRLTRNLYDLRALAELPEQAIQYAVEVNNDPSVRNIRLAVVANNESVTHALRQIAALTTPGGAEMALFTTLEDAENWLNRPLTLVV